MPVENPTRGPATEAVVVYQLAARRLGVPVVRLKRRLDDINPEAVEEAIDSLHCAGVLLMKRTWVHPSPALARLDELGVICI